MATTPDATAPFRGFSTQTTTFLGELSKNNAKAWFDQNRAAYDEFVMPEAKAFVEAAGVALRELSPTIVAEPRVNGSIFRINRDTRFSKDKTPYKDYLDFWFWDDTDRKSAVTGFYFRVSQDSVDIGVGAHRFGAEQLTAYRGIVASPKGSRSLLDVVGTVKKAGFTIEGEHYKRMPKGFAEPKDEALSGLLRHNALWSGGNFPQPKGLTSARFVDWCMTRWRKQAPLHNWLRDNLQ